MPTEANETNLDQMRQALSELRRQHHDILQQMRSGQKKYQLIATSVWRVQEQERRRLARELHDGVGQNLTALKNALVQLSASSDDPQLTEQLNMAVELCAQSIADTRELSRLLRPQILDDLGLKAALNQLVRVTNRSGVQIEIICSGELDSINADLQTLAYRVVQEALNNVVKHARAKQCTVTVRVDGSALKLDIIDDGCGFAPSLLTDPKQRSDAFGTVTMRERVALFGGSCVIQSRLNEGTRIKARIPLTLE